MAVLVLADRGQAEQKVLLNLWRRLRHQSRAAAVTTPQSLAAAAAAASRWEQAMALSAQFLAQLGPEPMPAAVQDGGGALAVVDFRQPESLREMLAQWLTGALQQPSSAAAPTPAGAHASNPTALSPVLLWALVQGLGFAVELAAAHPLSPREAARLLVAVERLLADHHRTLDDAALGLCLRAYGALCPLARADPAVDAAAAPLRDRLPLLRPFLARAAAEERTLGGGEEPSLLSATGTEALAAFKAPSAALLSALGALVKESWEGGGAVGYLGVQGHDQAQRLSPRLHALPALRALAAAHALAHAKGCRGSSMPDPPLLRASLDAGAGAAGYRDRQAAGLRLLAPCFLDAYLSHDLGGDAFLPLLEGRETAFLAGWIGLTLESAAWVGGRGSGGHRRRGKDEAFAEGGASSFLPEHYLQRRYWAYTARLLPHLAARAARAGAPALQQHQQQRQQQQPQGRGPPGTSSSSNNSSSRQWGRTTRCAPCWTGRGWARTSPSRRRTSCRPPRATTPRRRSGTWPCGARC